MMRVAVCIYRSMKLTIPWFTSLCILFLIISGCQEDIQQPEPEKKKLSSPPIENFDPVPSSTQLSWQDAELVMFIHYGMNTMTGYRLGHGNEDPSLFNPTTIDVKGWASLARVTGFQYVIFTAKHHDGFCLWPTKTTGFSIKKSPYKNGKGDLMREFADACREAGLIPGFYISPWDRNQPLYGTYAYNDFYLQQFRELLTGYGEMGEIWLDGFAGVAANGQNKYFDWKRIMDAVENYQPHALVSIMGPDIRWVGNETGLGNDTEWSAQEPRVGLHASIQTKVWWPSEADVSIRPGWFYYEDENLKVKTADELVDLYLNTVGKNCNLLLNVPPRKDGSFHPKDVASLLHFRNEINIMFAHNLLAAAQIHVSDMRGSAEEYGPQLMTDINKETFWVTNQGIDTATIEFRLPKKEKINLIRLEEAIRYGQRVKSFKVSALIDGVEQEIATGTTIGRSRILRFPDVLTDRIIIDIEDAHAPPAIRLIGAYYYPFIHE